MKGMGRFPVIAVLILSAMLNWSTTCCCGESMFVEIARGGCMPQDDGEEHHQHGHAGSEHAGDHRHSCHKDFGSSFIPDDSSGDSLELDLPQITAAVGLPLPEADSQRMSAAILREQAPPIPPPDIPVVIRSLLI